MEILVTGGAGYIGSHVAKALSEAGLKPVVVDNLSTGHQWAVQWGPFYNADIRDSKALNEIFSKHSFAGICHFAALSLVSESVQKPELYFDNNVNGSRSLIETALQNKVMNFVFSSTCAVYGEPQTPLLTEDHPKKPVSPYGETKLEIEMLLQGKVAEGLNSVCLRYFNASGADKDFQIGEAHNPETHLIPVAISAALGAKPMSIFGNDYPTEDGTCVRDYIHVSDLATAHVLALNKMLSQKSQGYKAINLGTGIGLSNLTILKHVEAVTGRKIASSFVARRPGDPASLVADAKLGNLFLGWKPVSSDALTIVTSANQWYQKHYLGF